MPEYVVLRRPPEIAATSGVRLLPPSTRFIVRGAAPLIRDAGAALGIDVAPLHCRASHANGRALLWLGPDEYLLLAADGETSTLASAIGAVLQGQSYALVDVGHRHAALEIFGHHAAEMLNSGCPLDLDATTFPVDMCTRTVFAKSEIILWRTAADAFRVEVWRSFADYVARYLADVAREF